MILTGEKKSTGKTCFNPS